MELVRNTPIDKHKLILKETGKFLLIYPVLTYDGLDVNVLQQGERQKHPDGTVRFRVLKSLKS
ncbi:MAG: hypothetical protein JEZ14_19265 [Marinilabiliaceae bacterium]|nr:hypothetical protein [Marinilabiliaceae bacterium]